MKGDFSRLTGRRAKYNHYNGVLKQQGRVQLDWEWNELISIIGHQRKARTIDTIGQCGAPIHNSGFEILHPGNGFAGLLIATGRFYAGGLLCESSPGHKLPITGFSGNNDILADDTQIDGVSLSNGQWVQISTKEDPDGVIAQITNVSTGQISVDQNLSGLHDGHGPTLRLLILFSEQPDLPNGPGYTPVAGQTDLLYLDVWERHISAIEDPGIREVALGGPDTDTRSRIIGQVKALTDVGNVSCEDDIDSWEALIKPPNGRLTTRLIEPDAPDNPCELGESGGYLGLENHLYRVEVHTVDAGGATFKWSRDNASTAYAIKEFFEEGTGEVFKISLQQNGKDDILKIKQQDWIEVSGEYTDLDTDSPGTLARVLKVEGTVLTLDTDVAAHKNEPLPKIRRWDTNIQTPDDVVKTIVSGTGFVLEDGIEIEFSGTEFNSGDYWVFSARTLTGEIEILDMEAPHGIRHHYCKLGLVTGLADGNVYIQDCRPEFPPLTEVGGGGCCTVTVGDGEAFTDIQLAIDSLNGGPGVVCIKPGLYLIDKPILVEGRDITIKGCEGTPIIINTSLKGDGGPVFQVRNSWEIHIRDLWCITLAGARVVEVENTYFFSLRECMLVGGGASDLGGLVTFLGLGLNTRVEDNVMLGMIGIRYDTSTEQKLNFQLNARVERNIFFVLENAVLEDPGVLIWGFDLVDNIALGINLRLMSKGFFPDGLYAPAEKAGYFSKADLAKAKEAKAKEKETAYARLREGKKEPAYAMNQKMKAEAAMAHASYGQYNPADLPAGKPLVDLSGNLVDGRLFDNLLLGAIGINVNYALECEIKTNLIVARQYGIVLGLFEGMALEDNAITSGAACLKCNGIMAMNLVVANNRLISQSRGIDFMEKGQTDNYQIVINNHFNNNWIDAGEIGIAMEASNVILADFTMVDNTIRNCGQMGILILALDENQFQETDSIALQRVIQRNSISVPGTGLMLSVSDVKILENEINIDHTAEASGANFSRGIYLVADNGVISNNTIQAVVDAQGAKDSMGGIYLRRNASFTSTRRQQVEIRNNQILGGIQNGIEVDSDFSGLRIEENQIAGMGLNGIAVARQVALVDDLLIVGNHIQDCLQLVGRGQSYWKYAGIVLTTAQKVQISGNVVCNNGLSVEQGVPVGGLFAEFLLETNITDNQFINNEPPGLDKPNDQAVVHIPSTWNGEDYSINVQITNNLVQSTLSPSLFFGDYFPFNFGNITIYFTTVGKALVSGNQFESSVPGPTVRLETYNGSFSSNQVSCGQADSSVLGHGYSFIATNNIVTDAIIFVGGNQIIDKNLLI